MKDLIKKGLALTFVSVMCFSLAACGGSSSSKTSVNASYNDGTYEGRSSDFEADESGNGAGYGQVTIEIKDNKIVSCEFELHELDGTLKDETYGADLVKENRLKAQKAVQSAPKYASQLVEAGNIDGVDAISGATISYNEFTEAVNDALSKAVAE